MQVMQETKAVVLLEVDPKKQLFLPLCLRVKLSSLSLQDSPMQIAMLLLVEMRKVLKMILFN